MWGAVFPRCGDLLWGESKETRHIFLAGLGKLRISDLDQAQFKRPFDSPPAAIDIEFVVNTFGMGTHCT